MDVRTVVTELIEIIRIQATLQRTSIEVQFSCLIPSTIYLDTNRFKQVLFNLLTNAVKFTHDGKIEIQLQFERSDTKKLHVAVYDSGIGIPRENFSKVFSKF